jgi:hypothetical protein
VSDWFQSLSPLPSILTGFPARLTLLTSKMEAEGSSETLIPIYQTRNSPISVPLFYMKSKLNIITFLKNSSSLKKKSTGHEVLIAFKSYIIYLKYNFYMADI